ncbi:hypothetical protein DTW90_35760 [Neorhizobium sp. P12A]|jgi:hypothetical protein|uniref:hypothetical protein n=1 Tax=Neorhizobium sp. P12A TaxID=2268027 RepID=UPI0011EFBEB3|nr:hypothetical protein [Neorhizobium sp. P12A]KAA0684816.1 hypothetical protein DTW90_35760 [Neorhizobium sp. P12A]
MAYTGLEPDGIYWARRKASKSEPLTVVQVSTLFGDEHEYWTLVQLGSDQHHMPGDFEIVEKITDPSQPRVLRQAAE